MFYSTSLLPFLGYLAFASGYTLFVFWFDKRRSLNGGWRMPERGLLMLAAFGGSPGAKLGQRLFRHKTSKQPFARNLNRVIVAQIAVVAVVLAFPPVADEIAKRATTIAQAVAGYTAAPEEPVERVMPRRFGPGA